MNMVEYPKKGFHLIRCDIKCVQRLTFLEINLSMHPYVLLHYSIKLYPPNVILLGGFYIRTCPNKINSSFYCEV